MDPEYMTELMVDPMFLPPWIDVFPLEGLPENFEACKKHYNDAHFWKVISKYARVVLRLTHSRIKRFI